MNTTTENLIERLASHRTMKAAPREELAWIAVRSRLRTLAPGEILTSRASGRAEGLFFILSGRLGLQVDRGAGRHKVMEWRAGAVAGLLPYSRMGIPPGDSVAEETTEIVALHRDHIPEMILACHETTSLLVHAMVDRAREFTSSELHDEKMVSLGKLAAGLAHELNNPASALARGAKLLPERLAASEAASVAFGACDLTAVQRAAIDEVRTACQASPLHRVRSPLEEADRESSMADWLDEHGADQALSEPLADTAVTLEALDRLAGAVEGAALEAALRWVAAGCSTRRLARELEESAIRIFDLITAVKGFTHMDQAAVPEQVDIGEGLRQTLAVIQAKARGKCLSVTLTIEPELPRVRGFGGELNQVWLNLIDNALDAAPASGDVEIGAGRRGDRVLVRVADNGPGIPPELRDRIFDAFFTTKPVGQGTGLGLDIARRLVRKNDGDIEVESEPGKTEFVVSLPIASDVPHGGRP